MVDGEFVGVHVDAVTTLDNSEAWHVKANFLWVKQSTEISFQVCKEEQGTYQVKINGQTGTITVVPELPSLLGLLMLLALLTALVVYAKRRSRVKQGLPKEGSKTDGTIFPSASSADDAVYV